MTKADDALRREQLTTAPKDRPDRHEASNDDPAAPRIAESAGEEGRTRLDVADTASVRPGKAD